MVGRGAPALAGGPGGRATEAPPGAGRACAAEGRRTGGSRASAGPSPRRGEAGERRPAGPAGARPGGGTGVSQPAAAGGREKLGQQQRRKDKMAAAQEEVRSEARAHGRGRGRGVRSGKAQLVGGTRPPSWDRAVEGPGGRLRAAILEPGEGCEGGQGRGAGSRERS